MHSPSKPCNVNDCAVAPCASRAPRVAQKLDGVRGACVLRVPFSRSPFLPITHARTHAIVPRKSDIPYHDGFANQKNAPIFTYRPIHTPFASSGQAAPALAAQHPVSPRFFRPGVSSSSNVLSFLSPHTQQRVEWPTGAWVHPSSSPSSLAVGSQAAPRRPKRRRIASSHESGFALRAGAVAWRLVFVNTMHACMHVFGVGVGQAVLHSAVTYSWRRSNV